MTDQTDNMTVQIRYKGVEKTFSGNAEEAWLFTKRFFLELIPSFEIANKLLLKADLQKLAKDCENIIAFSQEGPNVLVPRNKLTDNETLSLWLLANYLGSQLGILKNDTASKEELQARLGKGAKITSTRLGELVKTDIAARTADERYRITSFGVAMVQKDILPKIKTRIGV